MRVMKIFNLPFDPQEGFDDEPIQRWLGVERALVSQQSYLIEGTRGPWLIILIEAETRALADPYASPRLIAKPMKQRHNHEGSRTGDSSVPPDLMRQDHERAERRRDLRAQRQRDVEAALARLDERGRALFEHLRRWRATRAAEEGMRPYEFGSDLLLCEVAQRRPHTLSELRSIPSCKPKLIKIAGQELIRLIQEVDATQEERWRQEGHAQRDQSGGGAT